MLKYDTIYLKILGGGGGIPGYAWHLSSLMLSITLLLRGVCVRPDSGSGSGNGSDIGKLYLFMVITSNILLIIRAPILSVALNNNVRSYLTILW